MSGWQNILNKSVFEVRQVLVDSKKIKYNLLIGSLGQIVTLLLGIVVPKLVLTNYGSEINGLLSSVTNIYAYVALVEAGVAAASCQALYKAFANQSRDDINSILAATNKYYHRTGFVYLLLILTFAGIYPVFINTEIPYTTMVFVILFNGIGNVVNYFFHGKYLILLKADGKNYIRTGVEIFTTTFKQLSKIILIALGYNVVFVQFAAMLVSFIQMVYIVQYIKRNYSWIDLKVKPDFKAISQSKNVFIHQVNYLVVSNTDVVILTAFSNLKTVSIYSLYLLLVNMVDKVMHVIRDALEFKIANFFHTNKQKFLKFFRMYEVYYICLAFALYSVVDCFILPFLKLYTKGVNDINYIIWYLPFCFVITKLMAVVRYPYDAIIHICGHFKQTQASSITESIINIIISLLLVHKLGISGVLFGTVLAALYRVNYLVIYLHKNKIINRNIFSSYKTFFINFSLFITLDFASGFVEFTYGSYIYILVACIPYTFVVFLIYFAVNSVFEPQSFKELLVIIKNIIRKFRITKN